MRVFAVFLTFVITVFLAGVSFTNEVSPRKFSSAVELVNVGEPLVIVQGGDGSKIDDMAAKAIADVLKFWSEHRLPHNGNEFTPPQKYVSFDSRHAQYGEQVCGNLTRGFANAGYCRNDESVVWDRGVLLPKVLRETGKTGLALVFAHEIAHHAQAEAGVLETISVKVSEQQADCMAGAYLGWASKNSDWLSSEPETSTNAMRFAAMIGDNPVSDEGTHGSGSERAWAIRQGFFNGLLVCAAINENVLSMRKQSNYLKAQN